MDGSSIDNGNSGGSGENGLFSSASVSSENSDSTRHSLLFRSSVPCTTLKRGRNAGVVTEEQDWRCSKMGRIETKIPDMATEKGNLRLSSSSSFLRSTSNTTHSLFPDAQQMLSFSSPKQDALVTYYHHLLPSPSCCVSTPASSTFARNTGPNMNVHGGGVLAGVRGAFTPSQWVELEHQVMIYKYIDANAPIPPTLLISIKKTPNPFGSLTPPTAYGWGSCQLSFSGNSDPEPGRCRRTDGKKWRCSRDAVVDQKYCERHMNRGRHRSRKPVEGHTGQAKPIAPSPTASSTQLPSHHTRILTNKGDSVAKDDGTVAASIPKQYNPFEQQQSTNRADLVLSAPYNFNPYIEEGWPEENQSDRTELSISIPTTCCSGKSTSLSLSPPLKKLKTQEEPICMNRNKQGTWAPVSWGASMGGPLGEVLNNSVTANKNSLGLNMIDCWDSSPTGVLQKNSFGSHSSSAGSSPRASAAAADTITTTTTVAARLCDDLLGCHLLTSSLQPPSTI